MRILLSCLTVAYLISISVAKECGCYLAKSTIPGAGLGMFAGADFEDGEEILDGDIAVTVIDVWWHGGPNPFLWDAYTWSHDILEDYGSTEADLPDDSVSVCSFGIGAAVNCLIGLVNTDTSVFDEPTNAGLHRKNDPGAGAITPYHGRKTLAYGNVPAGMELFLSYGQSYFESREQVYGLIPFDDDYKQADLILKLYTNLSTNLLQTDPASKRSMLRDIYEIMKDPIFESRTLNAMPPPDDPDALERVLETGTVNLLRDRSIQTIEWLEENGKCMDNIRMGPSKISGAGRGAFATRFLAKGNIVAPSPLIHIANKSQLHMYAEAEDTNGEVYRNSSAHVSDQLLLNYCFGHRNSTLLLSPYGSFTSLINHSSKQPNARIQWASNSTFLHPKWLLGDVQKLEKQTTSGLAFDYIAVRDIEPGDEVLIDYGKEWEDAWADHVSNWVAPQNADTYMPAYELNADYALPLWPNDQPPFYTGDIQMQCHYIYLEMWGLTARTLKYIDQYTYPCRIIERYPGGDKVGDQVEDVYNVEVFHVDRNTSCTCEVIGILFGVPRDIFYFVDYPYTRDQHMHSAFRHDMRIPDDIFPAKWMNVNGGND